MENVNKMVCCCGIPDCDSPEKDAICLRNQPGIKCCGFYHAPEAVSNAPQPISIDGVMRATGFAPVVGGQIKSGNGSMVVDLSSGAIIIRGSRHSINDGDRDTWWSKVRREARRKVRRAWRDIGDAMFSGVDEAWHLIAKWIAASAVVYAVVVWAVHLYG